MSASPDTTDGAKEKLRESFSTEYYKLADIVSGFDKNLLTVKGWGVTLSLAALGTGFQFQRHGLFLVACVSGFAFWAIEGVMKLHQMRYYVRMRQIEVDNYKLFRVETPGDGVGASSPQIDWGWMQAWDIFRGSVKKAGEPVPYGPKMSPYFTVAYPHVAFPHVIAVLVGGVLFVLYAKGYASFPCPE